MIATHDPNITINITLDAAPAAQVGFSKVLHIVPLATNPLDGLRSKTYTSIADAQSDYDDSQIDAAALAAATTAFSQIPKPAEFMIGYIDIAGAESYADALAACSAFDDSFYGVTIRSRLDADILGVSAAVEATNKIFVAQTDDGDFKSVDLPAGLSALSVRERTAVDWHDEDGKFMDVGHACKFLVFDPDVQSAPGHLGVGGVDPYTTDLTQAEANQIKGNNANVGLPYGGAPFYVDPGKFITGRAMDEIVTADWLEIRLQQDIAVEIVRHSNRGEKVTVDAVGQAKILNTIRARLQQGVQAGHFIAGQVNVRALPIVQSDLDNGRLRFEGEAQLAVSGRLVTLDFAVGRNPVNVEA
jgi:hypothetical protein